MSERYSDGDDDGASVTRVGSDAEYRALLARLLPSVDASLLLHALRAEAARGTAPPAPASVRASDLPPAERELHRVRAALLLGSSARLLQHSLNNPLTALLAEAQLLEFEPLTPDQRVSVARIVELARRVASVVRRLDVGDVGDVGTSTGR